MSDSTELGMVVGVMALRLQFISQDDLKAGIRNWRHHHTSSLGEALVAHGALTARQLNILEPLAAEHVSRFGNSAQGSLEALEGASWVSEALHSTESLVDGAETTSLVPGAGGKSASQRAGIVPDGPSSRYRIVEFYKAGGLGEVYRARDDQFGRSVALKQIKHKYVHDENMRRRFVREAEINGRLEHPAIVPVYSLGKYDDGRPFYTMRFVAGDELRAAIKSYHSSEAVRRGPRVLELRQLLRRFIDVCNAIAYAHSRGIVHRDLKPGNVLLGSFGETFLIDWGLAKGVTDAEGDVPEAHVESRSAEIDATEMGTQVGTLPYMSPEQARGDVQSVGKAADTYGLGAMLYEILTGQPPVQGKSAAEILQHAKEGRIAHPRSLTPQASPALASICLKAMSFSPADRYPTAQSLAADVESWLADEPVQAYREPVLERMGRVVRRNRTTAVGVGVLLVTTIVALAVINELSRRQNTLLRAANSLAMTNLQQAQAENRRAEQNLEELRLTAFELQSTAEGSLARAPGTENERQRLTELLVQSLEKVFAQRAGDLPLRRDLAQAYRIHANLQRQFNKQEAALQFYAMALSHLESLTLDSTRDQQSQLRLAETLRDQSNSLLNTGDVEGAVAALDRAAERVSNLRVRAPGATSHARTAATIQLDLADPLSDLGRLPEALEHAKQAAETLQELAEGSNPQANDEVLLLLAINRQSEILREMSHDSESLSVLAPAIARAGLNPNLTGTPDLQHALARLLWNQAQSLTPEDSAKAETALNEAITRWDDLIRRFPQRAFYRRYRALASIAEGQLKNQEKMFDESQKCFQQACDRLEPLVKAQPTAIPYREALADARWAFAEAARAAGNSDQAQQQAEMARGHLRAIMEQHPRSVSVAARLRAVDAFLNP